MLRRFALVATIVAVPVLLGAQGASSSTLAQLFVDYWNWRLAERPELATQVGAPGFNDRWRDLSKASREKWREWRREYIQRVGILIPGTLTPSERLSGQLMEYELRTELDAEPYLQLVQMVSQMNGLHNLVFLTIDQMPARTVADYENIAARLRALPAHVDQGLALIREQMAAGLVQPRVVVDLMLDQVSAQAKLPAADSPLLASTRRFPADIPAAEQQRLRAALVAAYDQQFVPSWRTLESFLRDTYRPAARPQIAITSVPDGRTAYARLIRAYTTTTMTPEQIHEIGLQEVARIEGEMQAIARASGFTGSVAAFERQLAKQPGMTFSSQEEMLAYARDVLKRLEPELPRFFSRVPKTPVGVRPIPPDREASTASNYTAGTADGSRQAWFNMNTYLPPQQVKYRTEALVLHETVPGHHLQVGLARELQGVPDFRRVFAASAFSEGWALYAESLGPELGTVYRDPATRFGQLASEQFRAVRLVVDTGMHALGWSRDRAREYFALHVPSQSIAEIDRYIAMPGQALSYKLGELRIKELRRRAQQELGARFDLRAFHDAVLRNGTLPLDLLEQQVSLYIAAAKNATN